jgi:hypothetical protein
MRVAHEASDSLRRRRATARSAPSLANASSVAGGSWSVALDRLPIKYTIAKHGLLYNYNLLLGYEIGLADVWTSTDSLCCTAVGDGHLGRAGALEPRRDQSLELLRRPSASSRARQRCRATFICHPLAARDAEEAGTLKLARAHGSPASSRPSPGGRTRALLESTRNAHAGRARSGPSRDVHLLAGSDFAWCIVKIR